MDEAPGPTASDPDVRHLLVAASCLTAASDLLLCAALEGTEPDVLDVLTKLADAILHVCALYPRDEAGQLAGAAVKFIDEVTGLEGGLQP